MSIRPIRQIIDERPSVAKIDRQAKAVTRIQSQLVQHLPMRLRAVAQLELSLHIYKETCTLYSANGALCHALKSHQNQALKIVKAEAPQVSRIKVQKQTQAAQSSGALNGSFGSKRSQQYWAPETLNDKAINSLRTAAEYTQGKSLAEALASLADTLQAQKKRP